MTKAKFKKYRVIFDAWEAYQSEAEELKQNDFYSDLNDEEVDCLSWDNLCDDLKECVIPEIDRHAPHGIAVFADLGLWNGRRKGIKIVDSFSDVLALCDDLMYVTIETTPQGLTVYAPHHDGTNVYTLRALTEAGANRWSDYDDELEQSLIHGSPRTLRRYTKNIKNLWED